MSKIFTQHQTETIKWSDCISSYSEDREEVYLYHGTDKLFSLCWDDIAVSGLEPRGENARDKAQPILKLLLEAHNSAIQLGFKKGCTTTKRSIQLALGL